jgi:hypothetical protein
LALTMLRAGLQASDDGIAQAFVAREEYGGIFRRRVPDQAVAATK